MNSSRRVFLAQASVAAGAVLLTKHFGSAALGGQPGETIAGTSNALVIYHTNSTNGNMGPVHKTLGGLRQINTHLKNEGNSALLLDAGNFFNTRMSFEQQKAVATIMNSTGYKAAGISGLDISDDGRHLKALAPYMEFSLINCNHRFTPGLKSFIKPYRIFKNGAIKIGVTAVCTPLKGATYINAIDCANRTTRFLKENEGCQLVICLSDLGPKRQESELNDQMLAEASEHIDMIIGNDHGKLQLNDAVWRNKLKHEVVFSAAAVKGLTMGKTVFNFTEDKQKKGVSVEHIIPGKPAGQNFAAALRQLSLA
jgi:5'-nucleotidase